MSENVVFDVLVDFLVEGRDADRILAFRLPAAKQERLEELLQLNRDGALTSEQRDELQTFEKVEHVVRLMKARVAGRLAS